MANKKRKKTKIFIVSFAVFIVIVLFFYNSCRDHWKWDFDAFLTNNEKINIFVDYSAKKVWINMHPGPALGGGDERTDIFFNFRGKDYKFSTDKALIVLNFWKDTLYLVIEGTEEKETKYSDLTQFHYYKLDNGWKEISLFEFPKQIAIENIDRKSTLDYKIDNSSELEEYINGEFDLKYFKDSITAKLWYCLDKKKEFYTDRDTFEDIKDSFAEKTLNDLKDTSFIKNYLKRKEAITEEFLLDYKKKYIDPYWRQQIKEPGIESKKTKPTKSIIPKTSSGW